jgi:hypothetical protein
VLGAALAAVVPPARRAVSAAPRVPAPVAGE